jgi:hypothetical protein
MQADIRSLPSQYLCFDFIEPIQQVGLRQKKPEFQHTVEQMGKQWNML